MRDAEHTLTAVTTLGAVEFFSYDHYQRLFRLRKPVSSEV
jgi:hypothetical protein